MSLLRLNRHPSPKQLRVFAAAWLVFFGLFAWVQAGNGHPTAAYAIGAVAIAVPTIGLMHLRGLRLIFVGMTYATYPLGWVISHVVLAVMYYGVFTVIGGILRLCGHDPLFRRFDRKAESYWQPRPPERPAADYFRQG
jgi:hypothetical protein